MNKMVLFAGLLLPCLSAAAPQPDATKAQVIIQEIKFKDDVRRLLYPAIVDAKINSTVTADLDGHVRRIKKTLGAKVRAGEVVLYLENLDPAFTYSAVPVRSPVSGVLSQINFQLMSKVAKGEKLFTVMNGDSLKIMAEIPSSEINQLKPGLQGLFRLNLQTEKSIPVKVVGLSPIIDPRSGTASAELEFSAAANLPPVGVVGQVEFQISLGKVILLPELSLRYFEGKPRVRVVDEKNKAHWRVIEVGEQREDLLVVKSGLAPSDRVVLRASRSFKEDEEVDVKADGEQQ
jgi:multidrug efflux pump subunit AcrA (membrane-fusion protein)